MKGLLTVGYDVFLKDWNRFFFNITDIRVKDKLLKHAFIYLFLVAETGENGAFLGRNEDSGDWGSGEFSLVGISG